MFKNMSVGHTGSWGLPDFGITEGISSLFGGGLTAQGGSNLRQGGLPTAQINTGPGTFAPVQGPGLGWSGSTDVVSNIIQTPPSSPPVDNGAGGNPTGIGNYPGGPAPVNQTSVQDIGSMLDSGYNDYFRNLDSMLGDLSVQSGSLQNQAQAQTAQQQAGLDLGLQQGQNTLNDYQGKTLRDLSGNVRNMLNAGNIYLGSRGAGDSSATNMYSYGLNKFATQQRTNVMQDVSTRLGNLKNIWSTESNKLKSALDQRVAQIAQWFSEQQMGLKGQKAAAAQQKSQQALDIALQQLSFVQQQAANQKSALDSWVVNNAKSLSEATKGLQQNQQNMFSPASVPGVSSTPLANNSFWSTASDEDKPLFG